MWRTCFWLSWRFTNAHVSLLRFFFSVLHAAPTRPFGFLPKSETPIYILSLSLSSSLFSSLLLSAECKEKDPPSALACIYHSSSFSSSAGFWTHSKKGLEWNNITSILDAISDEGVKGHIRCVCVCVCFSVSSRKLLLLRPNPSQ